MKRRGCGAGSVQPGRSKVAKLAARSDCYPPAVQGDAPLLVISPHLDDAVLSLRHSLAGRPGSVVATVCTQVPDGSEVLSSWDAVCGFGSSQQAMLARIEEDFAALGFLGQSYGDLDEDAVTSALEVLLTECSDLPAVGPFGILHKDHLLIGTAFRTAATRVGRSAVWLYEDVPYRKEQSAFDRRRSRQRVRREGWWLERANIGRSDPAVAELALQAYKSQLPRLGRRSRGVRQVVWRANRPQAARTHNATR